jgi:ribokinase
MSKKIIVIGSSNVDFIMKMPRLPKVGESVPNGKFMQTYGGKGANQAVGAAKAGGEVWLINCVGDDNYGPLVVENLRKGGVHTDFVTSMPGYTSGAAIVLVGEEGQNYLSIDPGANYALTPEMLAPHKDFISDAAMMVLQYEVIPETLYASIAMARELSIPIIFNFAPAAEMDVSYLEGLDYLVVNETEAEFVCGFAVEDEAGVIKASQKLLMLGVKTVIITLGAKGAFVAGKGWSTIVPSFRVEAVDTTAAGDTFCGTLATALVEGKPLLEAVRFANAAAAVCVTRLGAQPSIPTRAEIEAMLESQA